MSDLLSYEEISRYGLKELMDRALDAKLRHRGLRMGLCTITNAKSGGCSEDCAFCAQSCRSGANAPLYPLKDIDTLLKEAETAKSTGADRFSLVTSGRGPSGKLIDELAEVIRIIKERIDIKVCASLGIMDRQGLTVLREAGLTRYHHNLEACQEFFPSICTTHTYSHRIETIKAAKEVGLEVCAGGIIGLGESEYHRYCLAKELSQLEVDSSPINLLVPIPGTPLGNRSLLSVQEILRTVAIFRLLMPGIGIRLAGGREKVLDEFQVLAFLAGADAMMIGGYLTTAGRPPELDLKLTRKIKELWKELHLS